MRVRHQREEPRTINHHFSGPSLLERELGPEKEITINRGNENSRTAFPSFSSCPFTGVLLSGTYVIGFLSFLVRTFQQTFPPLENGLRDRFLVQEPLRSRLLLSRQEKENETVNARISETLLSRNLDRHTNSLSFSTSSSQRINILSILQNQLIRD